MARIICHLERHGRVEVAEYFDTFVTRSLHGRCLLLQLEARWPSREPDFLQYLRMGLRRDQMLEILSMEDDCVEEAIANSPYGRAANANQKEHLKTLDAWFQQNNNRRRGEPEIPRPLRVRPSRENPAKQHNEFRLGETMRNSFHSLSVDLGQTMSDAFQRFSHQLQSATAPDSRIPSSKFSKVAHFRMIR